MEKNEDYDVLVFLREVANCEGIIVDTEDDVHWRVKSTNRLEAYEWSVVWSNWRSMCRAGRRARMLHVTLEESVTDGSALGTFIRTKEMRQR